MVEWTNPAKQDLKSIHDYIANDSQFYAKKVSSEIVEKTEILNTFPEIGRININYNIDIHVDCS